LAYRLGGEALLRRLLVDQKPVRLLSSGTKFQKVVTLCLCCFGVEFQSFGCELFIAWIFCPWPENCRKFTDALIIIAADQPTFFRGRIGPAD
jgi:hypothetical protein